MCGFSRFTSATAILPYTHWSIIFIISIRIEVCFTALEIIILFRLIKWIFVNFTQISSLIKLFYFLLFIIFFFWTLILIYLQSFIVIELKTSLYSMLELLKQRVFIRRFVWTYLYLTWIRSVWRITCWLISSLIIFGCSIFYLLFTDLLIALLLSFWLTPQYYSNDYN